MPKIICGPAGSGKTRDVYSGIAALAKAGENSLLLVPENMSHSAERRLLTVCGNTVSRCARVVTFTSLTKALLSLSDDKTESLDEGGRVLSMFRALSNVEGTLSYYKGAAMRPKLVSAMLDTVSEIINSGVSPEEFSKTVENDSFSDKLRDIAKIYRAYISVCAGSRLDPASLLDRAKEHIAGSKLFDGVHVFIDDFSGFSGQKYSFLERVLERCADMTVSVLLDDDPIFDEQRKTRDRFVSIGRSLGRPFEITELPPRDSGKPPELALCEKVFDLKAEAFSGDPAAVSVYSAEDPAEECELCAAQIRRLTLHNGARLRDIAVVSGNVDEYAGLLEGSFLKYGVPAFFSHKAGVLQKPVTKALLGPLGALSDDLSLPSVISYLKSGFSGLSSDEIYKLENYALTWNIHGSAWTSPFKKSTVGYDRKPPDEEARLKSLEESRQRATAPIEALKAALSGLSSCEEYASAFSRFIENSGLSKLIDARVKELKEAGLRDDADEHAQLLEIFKKALSQMENALSGIRTDKEEFYELLTLTLAQYEVGAIPSSLDSVAVSSFTSLAPEGVRHLFVLGARDGLLPPDAPQKSILTDAERDALSDNGIELSSDLDKSLELHSDIYRALASPDRSLTLFAPKTLSDGTECIESYILTRLRKDLFPGLRVKSAAEALKLLRLTAKKPLFEQACVSLSSDLSENRAAYSALYPKNGEFFDSLQNHVTASPDRLKSEAARARIFGNGLDLSPTSVEMISSCPFSYFCRFIMRAEPRREYEFKMTSLGTLAHEVAEKGVRELCEKGGDPKRVARRLCNEYVDKNMSDADSPRQKALLSRFFESVEMILSDLWDEIENSDFKPRYYEMKFGGTNPDAEPLIWEDEGFKCLLKGTADRVDVWNGYLKVVDYKTGSKVFEPSDLINGHNLQLFIYTALLEKAGVGRGAAAFYVPAKSELLSLKEGDGEAELAKKRKDEVRRLGVMQNDPDIINALEHGARARDSKRLPTSSTWTEPERYYSITNYCVNKVKSLAHGVLSGDISSIPLGEKACEWCDFRAVCHFDENDGRHYIKRPEKLQARQAIDEITKD
ncbi:MAG: PD-(D/E)XK nuclease family protein [Clostridia bacterium]|nr:PD-(D/E)XK nuclease family protein [Clostridia bacterium]